MMNKDIRQSLDTNMEQSEFDAILLFGLHNIQYTTGVVLPFAHARRNQVMALLWPRSAEPVLFIPAPWAGSLDGSCRIQEVVPYDSGRGGEKLSALIDKKIKALKGVKKIGIDMESVSQSLFSRLDALDRVDWASCDELLRMTRYRKTEAERELLKSLAMKADHAVNGCLHHITVDRRMSELTLAEELRIHSLERDAELQGYNAASQVCAGTEATEFWPNTPKFGYAKTKDLKDGDTIRVQLQHTRDGYWGVSARMMINRSHLSETQAEAYSHLNTVHELLKTEVKEGARCRDIFKKVSDEAKKRNIPLAPEFGLGHGIGVSPFEGPFLAESDETVLSEGMVLVLDPIISTKDGIYRSRNTIFVKKGEPEVVGWYKDWREPYTPIMSI